MTMILLLFWSCVPPEPISVRRNSNGVSEKVVWWRAVFSRRRKCTLCKPSKCCFAAPPPFLQLLTDQFQGIQRGLHVVILVFFQNSPVYWLLLVSNECMLFASLAKNPFVVVAAVPVVVAAKTDSKNSKSPAMAFSRLLNGVFRAGVLSNKRAGQ